MKMGTKHILLGLGSFAAGLIVGRALSGGTEPSDGVVYAGSLPADMRHLDIGDPQDRPKVFRWALRHNRRDIVLQVVRVEMEAQLNGTDHPGEVLLRIVYINGRHRYEVAKPIALFRLANSYDSTEIFLEYDGASVPLEFSEATPWLFTADCLQHAFGGRLGEAFDNILELVLIPMRELACGIIEQAEFLTRATEAVRGITLPGIGSRGTVGDVMRYWGHDALKRANRPLSLESAIIGVSSWYQVQFKESKEAARAREEAWRGQLMLDYLTGVIDASAVCTNLRVEEVA